uniref:Uncharacterized protein n=1 Tax=Aegilops tauschii subsp. strangulata TaxID=200361 RepID=A0A452ZD77_AEGTS
MSRRRSYQGSFPSGCAAIYGAWKDNYYGISQLSRYIFVAHFRSLDAVMFVITRQPWSMGSDNFLLEWMDPEEQNRNIQDYKFDTIYVTIRIYGISMRFRTQALLANILQSVGQISEFHPINQSMIFARENYIWGTIKDQVSKAVRDRVWVNFAKDSAGWAYLFYEKIGRICTFCGVMFHSVQHCKIRNSVLISRNRLQVSLEEISPNRFGQWMTNAELIPTLSGGNVQAEANSFSSFINPQLARLQKQFIEDPKGKGKMSEEDSADKGNQKELSLRKINEQNKRMEGDNSSKNTELQIIQKQVGVNTALPNFIHSQQQSQSGDLMDTTVLPDAGNKETDVGRSNYVEGGQVEALQHSVQQSGSLADPEQVGGAKQSGPLSQQLPGPPCTSAEEMHIQGQRYEPDLDQRTAQNNPLRLADIPSLCVVPSSHFVQTSPTSVIQMHLEDKVS